MKINNTFFAHHKTRKLEKLLDNDGVISLLKLWNYAEQVRPDGVLSNMDEGDIELVTDWHGDEGMLVYTLVEVGFLDERGGVYCLHDFVKTPPVKTPPVGYADTPLCEGGSSRSGFAQSPPLRGGMPKGQGGVSTGGFLDPIEEIVSDAGRFHVLKRANPQIHDDLKKLGIRTLSKEGYDLWKDCYRKNNAETIAPPGTPLRENMGEDLFGNYVKMLAAHRALAA